MDALKEFLLKAEEVEQDEDEQLTELLEEIGVQFVAILLAYIKLTQRNIEDVLQADFEALEETLEKVMQDFDKMPSKRKLKKILSKRAFVSLFDEQVSPVLRNIFLESVDQISKLNEFDFDFYKLSEQVTEMMDDWLERLPKLMELTTDKAVEKLLRTAYENGEGFSWLKARLAELPEFGYPRARMTAITESLRMYSAGGYESMLQNDAVYGARWRHTEGIDEPRHSHVALAGTVVPKGEFFFVDGEAALFPRDPRLSAKQSVYCHCWAEPVLRAEYLKGGD